MPDTFPCPKCGAILHASGEVAVVGDQPLPVFQCDDCIVDVMFDGEPFDAAYTFVVGPDGKAFDPAADSSGS